eukprot:2952490-Lingulodinium_polyedra.AAC.1
MGRHGGHRWRRQRTLGGLYANGYLPRIRIGMRVLNSYDQHTPRGGRGGDAGGHADRREGHGLPPHGGREDA